MFALWQVTAAPYGRCCFPLHSLTHTHLFKEVMTHHGRRGKKRVDRELLFQYFLFLEWVVFPCRPSLLQYLLWASTILPFLVYFNQILPMPVMLDNNGSVVTRTRCGPQLLLCRIKWERKPWTGRVACVSCVSTGLLRLALHHFPSSRSLMRSLIVWLILALSARAFSADFGAVHTGHVLQKQLDAA